MLLRALHTQVLMLVGQGSLTAQPKTSSPHSLASFLDLSHNHPCLCLIVALPVSEGKHLEGED